MYFYRLVRIVLLLSLLTLSCITAAGEPGTLPPEPLKLLLITGGGWHDYRAQEKLLIQGLNARIPGIEWTLVHEGNQQPDHQVSVLKRDDWAQGYDLVIHNTGFGRVSDSDFVKKFVANHKDTPAVLIHSAVHSYRYAEPAAKNWFELSGAQSMWHEQERHFEIENLAPEDPVMAGFPKRWQPAITEELYVVEKLWGEITPLAQAYGPETEKQHPVIWKHQWQGERIFVTTLGAQ